MVGNHPPDVVCLYPNQIGAHLWVPGAPMTKRSYAEHARVTAICVNLALDGIEQDIREELEAATGRSVEPLRRVLTKLKHRRLAERQPTLQSTCRFDAH
jgi:hypothetical protein